MERLGPFAVIKEVAPGKLILKRAQNSGKLTVTATISNGGKPVTQIDDHRGDGAEERRRGCTRTPAKDEKPEDGQFYARDDQNEGTLHYNGTLAEAADYRLLSFSSSTPTTNSSKPKAPSPPRTSPTPSR